MKRFLILFAGALCLCACATKITDQVKVTDGTIQGTVLEDMAV